LRRVAKKSPDFFDKNLLQLVNLEQVFVGRIISSGWKALYRRDFL